MNCIDFECKTICCTLSVLLMEIMKSHGLILMVATLEQVFACIVNVPFIYNSRQSGTWDHLTNKYNIHGERHLGNSETETFLKLVQISIKDMDGQGSAYRREVKRHRCAFYGERCDDARVCCPHHTVQAEDIPLSCVTLRHKERLCNVTRALPAPYV